MISNNLPKSFTTDFINLPLGTPERLIHAYWQLNMMRFHTFSDKFGKEQQDTYNQVNHELGVQTIYIDLGALDCDYKCESKILNVVRGGKPTWVWFINCNALLNSSLAGWLRSILTTYNVNHIRTTFVLDNPQQFQRIFQTYSTPLYQSTMALGVMKATR
ncbi:hypothetical protein [Vibrio crassostreae]|uniref:hypothetical protein n=1 Tax=Vibrio crassostreae TaxID=246167 RepID=UPI001B309B1C|nr:hypothetical protein [Vibrio crassostreae]